MTEWHSSLGSPTSRILPRAQEQHLAVAITAPPAERRDDRRPVRSRAIIIDRAGSTLSAPIENARAGAALMLRQLDARDALSAVSDLGDRDRHGARDRGEQGCCARRDRDDR